MSTENSGMLAEFEEKTAVYTKFGLYMEDLLTELLNLRNLKIHSVTHRVKEPSSLNKKVLDHPEKNYNALDDITDLVGLRVITYFSDTVDDVKKLIGEEFEIDTRNSVDKRIAETAERFGYASLHLVVSLNKSRLALTENKRYKGLKCEVQVRTVLQHAWAEIEHDLGYKSTIVVPTRIKRTFALLAGTLEHADQQFLEIREKLAVYEAEARQDSEIESGRSLLKLDATTILLFAEKNKVFLAIEEELRAYWKEAKRVYSAPQYFQLFTAFLLQLGIKSISNLAEEPTSTARENPCLLRASG